jgi:hypothetical protein
MRLRSLLLFGFASLIPAAALAAGAPFATPPQPDVPLGPPDFEAPPADHPPVAAPPIDLVLPDGASHAQPEIGVPQGPPDPLPSAEHPVAPPDLIGVVDLPDAADVVLGLAPPFGGELGGGHATEAAGLTVVAVPEPTAALLLLLGLSGFALRRR